MRQDFYILVRGDLADKWRDPLSISKIFVTIFARMAIGGDHNTGGRGFSERSLHRQAAGVVEIVVAISAIIFLAPMRRKQGAQTRPAGRGQRAGPKAAIQQHEVGFDGEGARQRAAADETEATGRKNRSHVRPVSKAASRSASVVVGQSRRGSRRILNDVAPGRKARLLKHRAGRRAGRLRPPPENLRSSPRRRCAARLDLPQPDEADEGDDGASSTRSRKQSEQPRSRHRPSAKALRKMSIQAPCSRHRLAFRSSGRGQSSARIIRPTKGRHQAGRKL